MIAALRAIVIVLFLAAVPASSSEDRLKLATGSIEHVCTMQAVRPDLILTASHCVGVPGAEYSVYFVRGVAEVAIPAVLVWDGSFAGGDDPPDIALLTLERRWPHTVPLADSLPHAGDRLRSITYALGVRHWPIETEYIGLRYVNRFGWSIVFRGLVGGGASGAALTKDGKLVGTISAGAETHQLNVGVPVGTIARALRDLDRRGPMRADGSRER